MTQDHADEQYANAMTKRATWLLGLAGEDGDTIPPPESAIVDDMPAEVYHADPCAVPSLNAGTAHLLTSKSPLHAHHHHPRLGGEPTKATKARTAGQIVHAIIFENVTPEAIAALDIGQRYEVVGYDNFRTKAARKVRDRLDEAGILALTKARYSTYLADAQVHVAVAETVRERVAEHGVTLGPGPGRKCEVSLFWQETASDGTIVQCRGRLDQLELREDGADIYDLKRIVSAHPQKCEKSIEAYGYHVQRAAYVSAVEHNFPHLIGRVGYTWLFAETEEPFAVTPAVASGELRELGAVRWQRAIDTWARCLREDRWPGYVEPGQVARLNAMGWAMQQEMGS